MRLGSLGNPLGYAKGETTTLNAFVYRAGLDGAYLAQLTGGTEDANRFTEAAMDLERAINTVFSEPDAHSYYSGYFGKGYTVRGLPIINGLTPPSIALSSF